MRLRPEELEDQGYTLLDKLDHAALIPFVQLYLKKTTLFSMLYLFFNLIFFGMVVYQLLTLVNSGPHSLGDALTYLSYGLVITFLLVPLHEWIHVLAYKSQGAVNTRYDVNLKKFFFLAVADQFVANRREFTLVALAPFVMITLLGVILLFLVTPLWSLTILGILLTHTAICSGDFGMLSYFAFHKDRDIVTYDDRKNKLSYFLAREK